MARRGKGGAYLVLRCQTGGTSRFCSGVNFRASNKSAKRIGIIEPSGSFHSGQLRCVYSRNCQERLHRVVDESRGTGIAAVEDISIHVPERRTHY